MGPVSGAPLSERHHSEIAQCVQLPLSYELSESQPLFRGMYPTNRHRIRYTSSEKWNRETSPQTFYNCLGRGLRFSFRFLLECGLF